LFRKGAANLAKRRKIDLAEVFFDSLIEEIRAMGRIMEHEDVLITNYQEFRCERVLAAYPDTLIIGSEAVRYFPGEGDMLKALQNLNPWFDVVNCKSVVGAFLCSAVS